MRRARLLPSAVAGGQRPPERRVPKRYRYPLAEMKINDSFYVPNCVPGQLWSHVIRHAERLKITLTMRGIDGGTRVWRIK